MTVQYKLSTMTSQNIGKRPAVCETLTPVDETRDRWVVDQNYAQKAFVAGLL